MATRGIRRKKSTLSELKVLIIGAPSVGKSAFTVRFVTERYIGEADSQQALTVRFLTKRYIGEYDHRQDCSYRHELSVDGEPVLFEILDTCPQSIAVLPSVEAIQWADCICMVYSITDRESFNYVRRVKQTMRLDVPLALVGQKADMVHLRQVSLEEGEILAKDFECIFAEVAAAEQVTQVAEVFCDLCKEVLMLRRKAKHSLLDRMLGSKTAHRMYSRGKSDSALPKE